MTLADLLTELEDEALTDWDGKLALVALGLRKGDDKDRAHTVLCLVEALEIVQGSLATEVAYLASHADGMTPGVVAVFAAGCAARGKVIIEICQELQHVAG